MTNPDSIELIKKLVSFDTTSRESNLMVIDFIREYLANLGISSDIIHSEDGNKANLYATVGEHRSPGIMLSGHTDVVPIDGQEWDSNPFEVLEKDGKLFGRGTSDMKSFIAITLAMLPRFMERGLKTPLHLAFSYDEEVGCIGVRRLIDKLNGMPIKPAMCIVGEPTSMQVITGHKGKRSYNVHVRGYEAHSSLAPFGVNAIEFGAMFISKLRSIAERIQAEGPFDELYDVPYTTVHTGVISGGTQLNIVPKDCKIEFEFRYVGEEDPVALEEEIRSFARDGLEPDMRAIQPNTGISIDLINDMPGLEMDLDEEVVSFVKGLAERNDHAKVAFGTEAGLFKERAGIPTVVCGPGSIDQAHKPNEFIELEQIKAGEAFFERLMDRICAN
ncbi:MAG: acetylornithine deacetylase [Magnetovibrio sp.]|nr:acetylornithine deacetylase [Magnetovibrio sp.]|tara:strand:- start:818 stop:1981 length:1164 start_codon:yes stop_codon:yes gene_type:complete